MDRVILHCDCNSFFASVEAALDPKLNEYAFAVCGDPERRHGIVLAKNEKAKCFGVATGEPIWKAKAKCPKLVTVMPTYGKYSEYSKRVFDIYCRYTDLVEPFGIDECWLDVSGTTHLFGDGKTIADELRRVIKNEVGITISAGVSYNKIFAKMGSDYKKPDATTVIDRNNFKELLFPLPAGALLGVGKKSEERLKSLGIKTIGEIANADADVLKTFLGKGGEELHEYANGREFSQVKPYYYKDEQKSIGNGMTFKRDIKTESEAKTCIYYICDKVSSRMRKQGVLCRDVQVALKNTELCTRVRSKKLPSPTDLAFELADAAIKTVFESTGVSFEPIRAITVTGTELVKSSDFCEQLSLFDLDYNFKRAREESLEKTRDAIAEKFGKNAVKRCSLMKNEFGI